MPDPLIGTLIAGYVAHGYAQAIQEQEYKTRKQLEEVYKDPPFNAIISKRMTANTKLPIDISTVNIVKYLYIQSVPRAGSTGVLYIKLAVDMQILATNLPFDGDWDYAVTIGSKTPTLESTSDLDNLTLFATGDCDITMVLGNKKEALPQ